MDEDGTLLGAGLFSLALRGDLLEVDHELLWVVLGESKELCRVECEHVVGDDLWGLGQEVGVVDAEVVVEPVDLTVDELGGEEASLGEDVGDLVLLGGLCWERRWLVATEGSAENHPKGQECSHGVLADPVHADV